MKLENQHIINITLFFAVTICFAIGALHSSSVILYYFLVFLTTLMAFLLITKSKKESSNIVTIFLATLFFGLILALMVNLDYANNGKTFRYPDQMDFFENAVYLASNNSVFGVIRASSVNYIEYNVAYGLFGILGYFDKIVTGSVNFLPLIFSVVYITAFIPIILYYILKLYVPSLALKGSLYYGLLTPIMAYSGYLLRDIHMALLFMIILLWIVKKITIPRILGIFVMLPIIANLRLANSLLVLALLAIYIFSGKTSKIIRIVFIIFGLGAIIYFANEIGQTTTLTLDRLERYEKFTMDYAEESDGLGKQMNRLPPVIKETATIFIGLISFPFWGKPSANMSFPQLIMVLYSTISNIGWFFIIIGVFYFNKQIYFLVRNMPNKTLLFLIILFVLYLIMNVNNMNLRRIIYVFPYVYIPFLMIYQDLTKKQKKTYKLVTFSFGLFLSLAYIVLLLL